MPVEIKELHVKATVGRSKQINGSIQQGLTEEQKEELIQECLERMMKALKMKNNR